MKKIIRMAIVCTLAGAALLTGCTKDYSQDINAVDQKVNALSTEVNNLIANLEPRVGSLEAALPALKNTVEAGYKAADEALQKGFTAEANAIKESVKTLQDNVTALSKDLAAQKTALADLEKAYKAGDEATLAAAKAAAEAGDAVLQKNIDAANANIAALQNEAATIKAAVAENTEAINALQESAKESAKALESLKAAVKALADQIQSISVIPDNVMGIAAAHVMFAELTEADKEVSRITPKVTLNVDVEPAELAGTITTENAVLRTVISDGFSCPVNDLPVEIVEAENNGLAVTATLSEDFLKAYEELSEKAFGAWNFSVALVVKNANVVDGVDLGSYVASDYAQASFGVSPANRFVEVFPAIYVEEKDKFYYKEYTNSIKVPWNEYRNSTRNLFDGVQVGYVAYAGYEQEAFMTPEEVAEMFDKDAETLAPVAEAECTIYNLPVVSGKKDFTAKEDGWNTTAAVNTTDIKKDADAKQLVNPTSKVVGELTFTVKKDNVTSTFPVTLKALYTIVNKKGGVVTVDPVSFVWDYTQADGYINKTGTPDDKMVVKKEIPSSDAKKATDDDTQETLKVYDKDGKAVEGASIIFRPFKTTTETTASKLVDYVVKNVAYTDEDAEYKVKGVYTEKNVDYPVTSSFTVSAMPETPQEINLGQFEMAGSLSKTTKANITIIDKIFGGNEALYLGKSGYKVDALYASLAGNTVYTKITDEDNKDYTSQILPDDETWELIYNGKKVNATEYIAGEGEFIDAEDNEHGGVELSFYQKKEGAGFVDRSAIYFKSGKAGYGDEFILTFPVTAKWGITYNCKVVIKVKSLETALVPSGFIQDGVVTVGGAVVGGKYTINAIKMYSYFTLNAGDADPADFYAKVTYKTPAGEKFGNSDKNKKANCTGVPGNLNPNGDTYTFDKDGLVNEVTPDFTWAPYTGLKFTTTVKLYKKSDTKAENPVGKALVFDVVTPDPIQKVVWGDIKDTRKLNTASSVYLYQNVEVYGCLDATKDLCFYNSDEMYEATLGHPWVTFTYTYDEDGNITGITNRDNAGNQIYGQDFDFNYDPDKNPAKVYVNGVEQRASDIIENITGYELKIKSVSAAGKYTFEIPAKLTYSPSFAQTGVVVVTIDYK